MSRLFKNKYRIASARLQSWDYGWNAAYYVNICTRNRICHFGNVVDGIMQLSDIGLIADTCWLEIPQHFPFVKLGNHIVMPNHVHGIVIIDKHDPMRIPRFPPPSTPQNDDTPKNKFGPQSQNLASIIRGFKTGVTKNARLTNPDFKWQPRYHEHIIRDQRAFLTISKYISDNPRNWRDDQFFI